MHSINHRTWSARNLTDDWGFSKIQKKPDTHGIGIELREPLNEIISEKSGLETGKSCIQMSSTAIS